MSTSDFDTTVAGLAELAARFQGRRDIREICSNAITVLTEHRALVVRLLERINDLELDIESHAYDSFGDDI